MDQQKKYKILIVEDEKPLREILVDNFKGEGFFVLVATNGEEGLKMALLEHPDFILLDIILPVMDGMTMLKKLREDEWGKEAKVMMLTNLSDPEKVSQALEQGSYDYLVKTDWHIDEVVQKVKEKL